MPNESQTYLQPYLEAAQRYGDGFGSLLWASPQTQAARFDAFTRLYNFDGRLVLDAGAGRADFLDFLISRNIRPAHYVGLEAVPALATAATNKSHRNSLIVQADFVREPTRLLAGADVVVFSGSLNTLDPPSFFQTLKTAYAAATEAVVFNFLSSPFLAAAKWLNWHERSDVETFVRTLTPKIAVLEDYLRGDCTFALYKEHEPTIHNIISDDADEE